MFTKPIVNGPAVRSSLKKIPFFCFLTLVFLAGVVFSSQAALKAEDPDSKSLSIVFVGDIMLDGGPGHAVVHGKDPFAELAPIFQSADLVVGNLECVLTTGGEQVLKPYTFRCEIKSVPLLKKYFSALSIANNHSGDYGPNGFLEQLDILAKNDITFFGGGKNLEDAQRALILQRKGIRIALLGANRFPPKSFAARKDSPGTMWLEEETMLPWIETAKTKDRADLVFPCVHWGQEMEPAPTEEQQGFARKMIDAGASAVIGGHPHVVQTIDIYRGKPIVYSLGNFVFDYFPVDPEKWIGWVVRLTYPIKADKTLETPSLETFAVELDAQGLPHLLPDKK